MAAPHVESPGTAVTKRESYKVRGTRLLEKVKEVVHEGNVRRIIIKNDDGHTIVELPLTIGVVSAVLIPMWVAVGAIAALAADYTIEVEKEQEEGIAE